MNIGEYVGQPLDGAGSSHLAQDSELESMK